MPLCPIALLASCRKCAVFAVCPLKSVIGDYRRPEKDQPKPKDGSEQDGTKPAT